MSLVERVFREPELGDEPPVLVDVGAAGGVAPIWRSIARHCVGVGFEPDARDAAKLGAAGGAFLRWVFVDGLVAPAAEPGGKKNFFLTASPHCSSLLKPRPDLLNDWLFADYFAVRSEANVRAVTLPDALAAHGLARVDWLKCDTQGQDLSIFLSLPREWRERMLAVEFEPGLVDAYDGEDKFWSVLRAMEDEPFWICDLKTCGTQRGNEALFRRELGPGTMRWLRKLAPPSPTWVNVRYLRDISRATERLDRRGFLLGWVFADLLGQHGQALMVAEAGAERFGGDLFKELSRRSARRLRWSMLPAAPLWLWRRLGLPT